MKKLIEKIKKIIKGKGKPFLILILIVVVYFIGYFMGSTGPNPAAEGLSKDMYDFFDDIVNAIPDKETQEQIYFFKSERKFIGGRVVVFDTVSSTVEGVGGEPNLFIKSRICQEPAGNE